MNDKHNINDDQRRNIPVLARYAVVIFVMVFAAIIITYKMVHTTIIDAERWNEKAQRTLSKTEVIEPERGNILAADGSVIATNLQFYNIYIDYTSGPFEEKMFIDSIDVTCKALAKEFPVHTEKEWKERLMKPMKLKKENRPRNFVMFAGARYEDYLKLRRIPFFNQKNRYKCGLVYNDYFKRVYPYGDMAARSIGHVGRNKHDSLYCGRWGIERSLDSLLYGKPGVAKKIPSPRWWSTGPTSPPNADMTSPPPSTSTFRKWWKTSSTTASSSVEPSGAPLSSWRSRQAISRL